MTKSQTKQIEILKLHQRLGNTYAVAAGLSALVRSAMNKRQRQELLGWAAYFNVLDHEAFIV